MTNLINVEKGIKYLSQLPEFQSGLPNGVLEKGSTGAGMTHLALTHPDKYIIALPLNAAIDNKTEQIPNLFVVRAGVRERQLLKYIKEGGTKILVTYDSLFKLRKWLGQEVYTEWKLLVDEYQDFLRFYSFKKVPYKVAVKEVSKYKHKTLGSATPIPAKYSPKLLQDLPVTVVKWPHVKPIQIASKQVSCPTTAVIKMIKRLQEDGEYTFEGVSARSLNIFVNSIETIKTIINNTDLSPEECRVICGSKESNEKELGEYIGLRGKGVREPYLITFITSAGYNSIDLYGDSTASIALSYGSRQHTLQSTFIDLPQIAGRMRNEENPFYRVLFHLYTTVPYELDSKWFKENPRPILPTKPKTYSKEWQAKFDELEKWKKKAKAEIQQRFNKKLAEEVAEATADIQAYNSSSRRVKNYQRRLIDKQSDYANYWIYSTDEDGEVTFEIDEDYITFLKFQLAELTLSYIDGRSLRASYEEAGLTYTQYNYEKFLDEIVADGKIHFTTAIKGYLDKEATDEEKEKYSSLYPEILTYIKELGESRIRGLDYSRKALKEELNRVSTEGKAVIRYKLSDKLTAGEFYSSKELKAIIQETYNSVIGFKNVKAKASDITKYYCDSTPERIWQEGKRVRGYIVKYYKFSTSNY